MNDLTIRRRGRLLRNYTQTSNVLLFGYPGVSDSAKLTYQVIDALDWTDKDGSRKGFAYPTMARLADLRGTTGRTVRRHLLELEAAGLMTRQERPGSTNLLVIEDPSADQAPQYLTSVGPDPDGEPDGRDGDDDHSETPDKIVRPPRTKLSAPYMQEIQKEEIKNNVEQALVSQRREEGSDSTHISTTLRRRAASLRLNPSDDRQRFEVLADQLCAALGDQKSRDYFRLLARTTPAHVLYECAAEVRQQRASGTVRSAGALFVAMVKRRTPLNANPRSQHRSVEAAMPMKAGERVYVG